MFRNLVKFLTSRGMRYKSTQNDYKNGNKWLKPRAIITRWTPLSCTVYGLWLYKRGINEDLTDIEVHCYTHLPLRIVSKAWGGIANTRIPISMRPYVYQKYSDMFDVNMDEVAVDDLTAYETLCSFFVRKLKPEARTVDKDCTLVSPCDGKILHCGPATSDVVEQIKGVTYKLEHFLGENSWTDENAKSSNNGYYESLLKNKNNVLHQCVIYLAPGDYHRFHSPCDWTVTFRRHFSGKLLSVNPLFAKLIPGLFCVNERVVYAGEWEHGFFSFTPVGATNVGSIQIYKDDRLKTNGRKLKATEDRRLRGFGYERGEMTGQFSMGSTVVLIFEAPAGFKFAREGGDRVKMGEKLGDIFN